MILGMGMGAAPPLPPASDADREASAKRWAGIIESTDQAKAALGFIAEELHIAYEAISKSDADWRTREEMRQLLDQSNRYAQEVYADVQAYDDQGLDFADGAAHVGRVIGWLYYDVDRQLQLASSIADFYEWGWSDAFWEAVGELPHMAKDAVLGIVDTGKKALDTAIGWPTWLVPAAATIGLLGVGVWGYLTFLEPAGATSFLARLFRKPARA